MTIPQPIEVKLTVDEAVAIHVVLTSLIREVEADPETHELDIVQMMKRAAAALAGALTKAGCILDDEGWRA